VATGVGEQRVSRSKLKGARHVNAEHVGICVFSVNVLHEAVVEGEAAAPQHRWLRGTLRQGDQREAQRSSNVVATCSRK